MAEVSKEEVEYPRELFNALIVGNSPYAFYLFQWVPYQTDAKRWRLKMLHDVKTFDGREAHGIWPNGSHCGPFRDDEVEFIRISRKQWGDEWTDPRPVSNVEVEAPKVASTAGLGHAGTPVAAMMENVMTFEEYCNDQGWDPDAQGQMRQCWAAAVAAERERWVAIAKSHMDMAVAMGAKEKARTAASILGEGLGA